MSVLKGEGTHSILYGSTRLPVGRNLHAYIARPDAAGAHPTVIVGHPAAGITSHIKGVCRRLARHGFAAICPDLYRSEPPTGRAGDAMGAISDRRLRSDLGAAVATAAIAGTGWADAARLLLLGIGDGARAAVLSATGVRGFAATGLISPVLTDPAIGTGVVAGLEEAGEEVLSIVPGDDPWADADLVAAAREAAPESVWIVYQGMGPGFTDETAPAFDPEAAEDAWGRVIDFITESILVADPDSQATVTT